MPFTLKGHEQASEDEGVTLGGFTQRVASQTDTTEEDNGTASPGSEIESSVRRHRSESSRGRVSVGEIARFDSKLRWGDMENLEQELNKSNSAPYLFAGSFAGVSGALSVGYVMWTVRGGLLATSLLAHLPAWSFVDPLLVLNEMDDDDEEDDDSLEEMLDKNESAESGTQNDDLDVSASDATPSHAE